MSIETEAMIIIIILAILTFAIIGCMLFLGQQISEDLKKKRKLHEIEVYNQVYMNTEGIYNLLDSYINERLDEYRVFHSDLFAGKSKLTDTEQTKISKDITIDVIETMSPSFYIQLTLVFNPNKDKIYEIIHNRVVMAFVAMSIGLDDENGNILNEMSS